MAKYCKFQIANCKLKNAESDAPRKPIIRHSAIYIFHFALCIFQCLLLVVFLRGDVALADDTPAGTFPDKPASKQKLLERRPFDAVTLTHTAGGATLEVQPISPPQRPLATLPKSGLLKVRVLDRPTE